MDWALNARLPTRAISPTPLRTAKLRWPASPVCPEHLVSKSPRWLALIGPGILVAATGVGAGDLVSSSLAGANVGVGLVWAIALGAAMKWLLTEGLARWQLATGTTLIQGGARLGLHWLFLPYLLVWGLAVGAALIKASGVALHAIVPLPLSPGESVFALGAAQAVLAFGLVRIGGYRLFEKAMSICIAVMFAAVVVCAVQVAPQLPAERLTPVNPLAMSSAARTWALTLIGGVGGTVTLLAYGYWIREEGRGSVADLPLCRVDLAIGYVVTALFGVGMLVIGAHLPALEGRGATLLVEIAARLREVVGPVGMWLFKIGAWAAVFSSLMGCLQCIPYLFTDVLVVGGWVARPAEGQYARSPAYLAGMVYLGLLPIVLTRWPLVQIQIAYGLIGALFVPMLAVALLLLNNHRRWMPAAQRYGWLSNLLLAAILAFFAWQSVVEIQQFMSGSRS